MDSKLDLTEGESRYLKLIFRKQQEEEERVKTTALADSVGVRPATVTETLQRLAKKGILSHEPYHGVQLTEKGISEAKKILRKHRILEVLLVNYLDFAPEKACEEARKLDYHASDNLIKSICRNFGHPEICPCGKRIFPNGSCREEGGGD